MKNIIISVAVLAVLHIGNVMAETCVHTPCPSNKIPSVSSDFGCKDAGANLAWYCYYNSSGTFVGPYQFCRGGCKDGFTEKTEYMDQKIGCFGRIESGATVRPYCISNVEACGTCKSDAWTDIPSIPYARRTQRYCDGATCKSQTQIGCKVGYYGTPTQVGSGCTQCPKFGNVNGTTSEIGATSVTECYVTSGTFCDATGCGTCNGNVYYVNY